MRNIMTHVDRWVGRCSRVLAGFATICGVVIMLTMAADVAFRFVAGRPLVGTYAFVETAVVWMIFLGIAHAERTGAHVRVRLVTSRLPGMLGEWVRIVAHAIALVIVAWMGYGTAQRAVQAVAESEYRYGLTAFPVWPARIIVAVGLCLLAIEFFMTIWRLRTRLRERGKEPTDDAPSA